MSPLQPHQQQQPLQQYPPPLPNGSNQIQQMGTPTMINNSMVTQYTQTGTPVIGTPVIQYNQTWMPQQQQVQQQLQQQQPTVVENGQQYYYYYSPTADPSNQQQVQKTNAGTHQYSPQYYVNEPTVTQITGAINGGSLGNGTVTTSVPISAETINGINIQPQQFYAQQQVEVPVRGIAAKMNAAVSMNNSMVPVANSYQFAPLMSNNNEPTSETNSISNRSDAVSHIQNPIISENEQLQKRMGHPRMITTMWEDEKTLCYQVEANCVSVVRRADNDMINGTKLLNVTKMTRGRRDGILRGEKIRDVVKIGSMHLKGVWIPFERAYLIAEREKIVDLLYPLFVKDIKSLLKQMTPSTYGINPLTGISAAMTSQPQMTTPLIEPQYQAIRGQNNQIVPVQTHLQYPYQVASQVIPNQTVNQLQQIPTSTGYSLHAPTPISASGTITPILDINNDNSTTSVSNTVSYNSTQNGNNMTHLPPLSYNAGSHLIDQYNPPVHSGSSLPKINSIVESGAIGAPTQPEYVELKPSRKITHHKKNHNDNESSKIHTTQSNLGTDINNDSESFNERNKIQQDIPTIENDSVNKEQVIIEPSRGEPNISSLTNIKSEVSTDDNETPTVVNSVDNSGENSRHNSAGNNSPGVAKERTCIIKSVDSSVTITNSTNETITHVVTENVPESSDADRSNKEDNIDTKKQTEEKSIDKTKIEAIMT